MIQTPVLDELVWGQFTAKVLDEDHLTDLATNFIPTVTEEAGDRLATEQRSLNHKLEKNRTAQKALMRQMAETDTLDTMDEVLGDLRGEEEVLGGQVADLDPVSPSLPNGTPSPTRSPVSLPGPRTASPTPPPS